jgi:hypothetical protein
MWSATVANRCFSFLAHNEICLGNNYCCCFTALRSCFWYLWYGRYLLKDLIRREVWLYLTIAFHKGLLRTIWRCRPRWMRIVDSCSYLFGSLMCEEPSDKGKAWSGIADMSTGWISDAWNSAAAVAVVPACDQASQRSSPSSKQVTHYVSYPIGNPGRNRLLKVWERSGLEAEGSVYCNLVSEELCHSLLQIPTSDNSLCEIHGHPSNAEVKNDGAIPTLPLYLHDVLFN